jgi:hypothetical protein
MEPISNGVTQIDGERQNAAEIKRMRSERRKNQMIQTGAARDANPARAAPVKSVRMDGWPQAD